MILGLFIGNIYQVVEFPFYGCFGKVFIMRLLFWEIGKQY